jgi:two-component system, response regulator PdtaR
MDSLRVAIADDDPGMRESLQQMLSNLGHEVVAVADNGLSLVALCATAMPDVVITGTLTPAMYGADAAAAVYKSRPIPIILYSRHCEPELVVNAEHKHVFIYLVKPICQEHLEAALKECQFTESSDTQERDSTKVLMGPAPESSDSSPHRELSRPPYRQRPR